MLECFICLKHQREKERNANFIFYYLYKYGLHLGDDVAEITFKLL